MGGSGSGGGAGDEEVEEERRLGVEAEAELDEQDKVVWRRRRLGMIRKGIEERKNKRI